MNYLIKYPTPFPYGFAGGSLTTVYFAGAFVEFFKLARAGSKKPHVFPLPVLATATNINFQNVSKNSKYSQLRQRVFRFSCFVVKFLSHTGV